MVGTLVEGDPLPSLRALARDLRISVITTKRSYDDLERDGFIETVAGKGCFVARQQPGLLREQQVRAIEEVIQKALDMARQAGLSPDEVIGMIRLLQEET